LVVQGAWVGGVFVAHMGAVMENSVMVWSLHSAGRKESREPIAGAIANS